MVLLYLRPYFTFKFWNEVVSLLPIIFLVIVAVIGGSIYFALPLAVQLILFAINAIVPDPIPYLDEIIMVGGILSKLKNWTILKISFPSIKCYPASLLLGW